MAVEPIFYGGTLSGRLIAVAARDDMTATMRLDALLSHEDEDVFAQREEAWTALSVGVEWAARALDTVGVRGTDTTPIGDSEGAFARGQHLGGQLFELSQLQGRHVASHQGPRDRLRQLEILSSPRAVFAESCEWREMIGGTEATSAPVTASATRSWEAPKQALRAERKLYAHLAWRTLGSDGLEARYGSGMRTANGTAGGRKPPCLLVL